MSHAARGRRVAELAESYKKFGSRFTAIEVKDLTRDQFPEALDGVDAVIHAAAPMPGKEDTASMINSAVEGLLNVVRQAEKAGIKRIVVTSSMVTVLNPDGGLTDKDWYPTNKEEALKTTGYESYPAAKTLAEKELWAFADAHPHVDITTINPPYIYGPFAETHIDTLPAGHYDSLSTDLIIYRLLTPEGDFPLSFPQIDVRDIAHAHVLALTSPPTLTSSVGRKRILIASPHGFDPKA
ncbi:hypothetical protein H0H93_010088, partial [Arthromyces matolae]